MISAPLPIVAMALLVSACGTPDDHFKWEAEHQVAARLKDPDSARFKNQFVIRQPDASGYDRVAACGIVDGKNGFGAYTGGSRFVVAGLHGKGVLDISIVQIEGPERRATYDSRKVGKMETIFEKVYWNQHCVDATHQPTYTGTMDD